MSFGGLLAPAATPQDIVAKLETACAAAAKDEAYVTASSRAAQPLNNYAAARYSGNVSRRTSSPSAG